MAELALTTLRGANPLGLFAALGLLDVVTRHLPETEPGLSWTDDVDPYAVLHGPQSLDEVADLCWADVDRWRSSPVLTGPPDAAGNPREVADLKVSAEDLSAWFRLVNQQSTAADSTDIALLGALVAQGAQAKGKPESKPTQFHFTAGQQKFLQMARTLRDGLEPGHFREALIGPWRYESELPVFGWDAKGERIYALSGQAPSSVKKTGVPGADWLGLLGLRFFPLNVRRGAGGERVLITTGCRGAWKSETFTWPLWNRPVGAPVVASLLAQKSLIDLSASQRAALGVHALMTAPIRRSDQGGYGSFGAPNIE